jgi:hypothetical protein
MEAVIANPTPRTSVTVEALMAQAVAVLDNARQPMPNEQRRTLVDLGAAYASLAATLEAHEARNGHLIERIASTLGVAGDRPPGNRLTEAPRR